MKSLNFLLLAILALHLQAYSLQVPRKDTLIQGKILRVQDRPNQTPQVLIDPVNPVRLPSSSVQLRGSVKNVDSKSVLYIWTQISGPMIAKIGSPEKSVTRVTNLQETGVYRFKLSIYRVVVNGSTKYNVLDDAFVDIKVIENRSPIVNAGPDQTVILPVNRVNLQGSARDPEGDNFGFRWRQSSGPMQALIQSPTQSSTQVNNLDEEGTYRFQLTVTDNRKGMGRDFVDVIVIRNNSPRANAGTDQLIVLPVNRVSLRGRGRDPDGDNIAFRWSQISGPMQTFIQTPTQSSTQVSNLNEEGIYRFQLKVSDGKNGEDNDVVNVTVRRNLPPIANAGSDQTITLPNNRVQLIGSGEDPDSDNLVYSWRQPDGPMEAIIETPDQLITEINGLTREGTYRFQLTIIDDMQGSDSDMVSVTVLPIPVQPISPPTVNAGTDQTITQPESRVLLQGSGNDPSGGGIRYSWNEISGKEVRIINRSGSSTEVTELNDVGTYQFELIVTSEGGTASDIVEVHVKPEILKQEPPAVNAGPDKSLTLPRHEVILNGSGQSSAGRIQFQWTKISGPSSFEIALPIEGVTPVSNLEEGEYIFELTVSDERGISASDRVTVTVSPNQALWIPPGVILLGGLILLGLGTSLYYFFWIPIPKKIMVFFMHKDEEELVRKLMPKSKIMDGYAIGRATKGKIKKMKKDRLAIHILNTTKLHINTPGQTKNINYSLKKGKHKFKGIELLTKPIIKLDNVVHKKTQGELKKDASDFPTFYIISLDEPLLKEYEKKLEGIGVDIIQHVPYNNYIIYVENARQMKSLSNELDFIRYIQHYTSYDRGLIIREEHRKKAAEMGDEILLDLILHREDDLSKVSDFVEGLEIKIVQSRKNRIRISASAKRIKDLKLSDNKYIQAIYEYIPNKLHNDFARRLVGIDSDVQFQPYINETGEGEIIAVADTGIDSDHPDLKSQIIETVSWGRKPSNDTSDTHGHGTHVTGSIIGDGTASDGKIKGIAPGAKVFFQSIMDEEESLAGFDMQLEEIFKEAYDKGARIHNNSWGSSAESRYTYDSTTVDEFIYNNPEMLIVISAGNDGTYNSYLPSEKGYIGFGSVCSPATNKNGLTVGASRSDRMEGGYATSKYGSIWPEKFPYPPTSTELISGDPNEIAAFSSRGKCDDGRMKPDIVAPGTDILSTRSKEAPLRHFHGGFADHNDAYAFLGGTSMSTPIVSGAAAIVREYYLKVKKCNLISAALVKATLINGTQKLDSKSALYKGDSIPNPNQGYGMLDLSMTIPNRKNQFQLAFTDSLQEPSVNLKSSGAEYTLKFQLKQNSWIRVCLAYTDYPARSIQNDLDLILDHDQTREKWSGNIGINAQDTYRSSDEDHTNNMETIRLDDAIPGLYTLKVIAFNLPKNDKGQGFAVVVTTGDMSAEFEK